MSTHKRMEVICWAAIALALVLTIVFLNGEKMGIQAATNIPGYEERLFDTGKVHTIEIIMDDWEGFLDGCRDEEYALCSLVIDQEASKNVAIRAKGNTSLTQVESYGNNRYSFKVEFDHYDSTQSYYGLDKLSLNNIIQDNTYMKDYLTYQMMADFGVDAPLCSYVYLTVNGQDWGLYLAVEGIEEAFLERNYDSEYGELYKPDSQSMGGGMGEPGGQDMRETISRDGGREMADAMGSSDVSLIYTDDAYSSYQNIFGNAKTDVTDQDKDRLIEAIRRLNEGEEIEKTVDIEEVIRYFVVHNFVCSFDSYTGSMIHNYYLYEKDGQLSMIPWDYNLAFGGFQDVQDAGALVNYPIDTPVSGGTVDSRPMLAWIFDKEEYTKLYHRYFAEFIEEYFDSGCVAEMLEQVREMIVPYVEKDPTKFCTYEEFMAGSQVLEEFCLLRAESIRGQLEGTIAATAESQVESGEALIDASHITIADMGSMNNGMGGMGNDMPNMNGGRGELGRPDGQEPPGMAGGPGQEVPEVPSGGMLILLGASGVVLAVGILIAALYKKRG